MSENLESEQGSGSPTGGGLSDESNGYVHVESDNEGADSAQMGGISVNQEPDSQLVDNADEDSGVVVTGRDVVEDEPDDVKAADDGGKEEFVDCSEELNAFNDAREAIEALEAEQNLGDDEVVARSSVSSIGVHDRGSGHREASPDKIIGEGEMSVQEYEEERRSMKNELANLQHQLEMKNQEIAVLNATINEHSLSHEVSSKAQLEKDQDIEASTNRMLASLSTVFGEEVFSDESLIDKMYRVERSTSYLAEMYKYFLSEVELLSHCLTEVNSDLHLQAETDKIFLTAREELVKQKHKEVELAHEISRLEDENRNLVDQVDKGREMIDVSNVEIGKLKGELEQEKIRYGNTKEKLSMAVTKGKALVQQRDSLKQTLADKTDELEKCLNELQEKSNALEAAELRNEDLNKSQTFVDSLQEALSSRDSILGKCEEVLSQNCAKEELQSLDMVERITWLANERNALAIEVEKLTEALSVPDLPENMRSSNLESRISWLFESYNLAKDEVTNLADEIAKMKEVARNEIDHLTASLLVETQEKNYLSEEFEELRRNYEGVAEKEREVSMEKEKMVEMLIVASGIAVEEQDDMALVIEKCIGKIKEQTAAPLQSSSLEPEIFEKFQTLLYLKDQECKMYEKILEEEDLDKAEMKNRLKELVVVSEELKALKDEKDSLMAEFQRSEEKATLLREKLSMAVKKGKGLVQDRENTKQLLGEKNALIEKLNLELRNQESIISDCRNQIDKLSTDAELIHKLETDLVGMQEQRDQLERFLMESNSMLQRVIESIDGINVPVDFEEPVQKVKWLAEYLSECQDAKTRAEEEIKVLKDETEELVRKLVESQTNMKMLEDELLVSEKNFSQLAEEKRELEIAKTDLEKELEKAMDEATSQSSKLEEACVSKNSLEKALALSENEKEDATTQLQKVKEEVSIYTNKLDEAYKTIQSLEDETSQLQTNISLLTEENNKAQIDRTELEDEIKKLKEETDSHASKFVDVSSTVKLLEDRISELVGEKKNAEEEIVVLNSQLSAYTQELVGKQGNRSLELSGYLESLQLLLKDETLSTLMRQSFENKIDSLKDIDQVLNDMRDSVVEMDSELLQKYPTSQDKFTELDILPAGIDNVVNIEMVDDEVNAGNDEGIIGKTMENFRLKNKVFADKFGSSSTFIDELLASLLAKLKATRDSLSLMAEQMKSMQKNVKNLETDRQSQENDIKILLSACIYATRELDFETDSTLEQEGWDRSLSTDVAEIGQGTEYVKAAEDLLSTARSVQSLIKNLQDGKNSMAVTVGDLQRQLEETRFTCQRVEEEKDASQVKASKLENALEASEILCSEMRFKLEEREAEITSLQSHLEKARLNFEKADGERDLCQNKLENDLQTSQNLCSEMRLKLEEREAELTSLQSQLDMTRSHFEKADEEKDARQNRVSKLENDLEASQNLCSELRLKVEEREAELTSLQSQLDRARSNFEKAEEEKDVSQNRVSKLENDLEASQILCTEMKLKLEEREAELTSLQSQLEMTRSNFEKAEEEKDLSQNRISKLANDLEASQNLCNEMRLELEEREAELTSLQTATLMKEHETQDSILSASQINSLFNKINEIEVPLSKLEVGELEPQESVRVKKLFYIVEGFNELQHQLVSLSRDKEELQSTLSKQAREVEYLKEEVEEHLKDKEDSKLMKSELFELSSGLEGIIKKLGGKESAYSEVGGLLPVLERLIMGAIVESQNSKSKAQELEAELQGTRQVVGELTSKVKLLEAPSSVVIQERSLYEAPSSSTRSEISEVEEVGPIGKAAIPPLPTAAHARTLRKGSSEQLAIDIDLESNRLIDNEKTDEDKGHVFKSLNTSGIVPVQGKMIADRLDGIWVSGGRALMSRPRARLGLVAYWLVLHLWLLGTIL